jgi:titin
MMSLVLTWFAWSAAHASIYIVSNTSDSGGGSLRNAIIGANANTGEDEIYFAIPGSGPHTIWPLSDLPTVTDTVTIDGATQTDYSGIPLIELDGSLTGALTNGLVLSAPACTVRALTINRFTSNGILLTSEADLSSVRSCYIGTDVNGTSDRGNHHHGICVVGAFYAHIGGEDPADRNVISGNDSSGVCLRGLADNTILIGNYIGTNAAGTATLGNTHHGVFLPSAIGTVIGSGISLTAGNLISGNGRCGVYDVGNSYTAVYANMIGTDHTGTADLGNGWHGVDIDGGYHTYIGFGVGGTNLISGNDSCGVVLRNGTALCTVYSNIIGANAATTAPLSNERDGVLVIGSTNNEIGGTGTGERNVISGNSYGGINIIGSSSGTRVHNNYVGVDSAGISGLGNYSYGVRIENSSGNTIGGTTPSDRNIISGNFFDGVRLWATYATGNLITGNYIGTDVTGTVAIPNINGILVATGGSNTIGGSAPGAGNVISGNGYDGIQYSGPGSNNTIMGNFIGTDHTGTVPLGNGNRGIALQGIDNTIGGPNEGDGNMIAFNGSIGVLVASNGTCTGNRILFNSIHSNGGLGIDLGYGGSPDGVTLNDPDDVDVGINDLQNHPVIWVNEPGPPVTIIDVHHNSTPNTTFRFEFFNNELPDPTGFGEGRAFIGWQNAATNASGNLWFGMVFGPPLPPGSWITATATDLSTGNTSEFSQAVCVGAGIELGGQVGEGGVELIWVPIPGANWYVVYGANNNFYFPPLLAYEIALLPGYTFSYSGLPAPADPINNWTYIVIALGPYEQPIANSNRVAEFDFDY